MSSCVTYTGATNITVATEDCGTIGLQIGVLVAWDKHQCVELSTAIVFDFIRDLSSVPRAWRVQTACVLRLFTVDSVELNIRQNSGFIARTKWIYSNCVLCVSSSWSPGGNCPYFVYFVGIVIRHCDSLTSIFTSGDNNFAILTSGDYNFAIFHWPRSVTYFCEHVNSFIVGELLNKIMAQGFIGNIGEFDSSKELFENYSKRIKLWMTVNKIEDNAKVNVFLALIGPKSFELITNMCAPDDPTTKSYDDLVKLLSDYYRVPRNPITERMELRKRVQQPGESVSNYVVELKRMSRYCEYGTDLESNLRDTFVAGVRDPNVKQKLLLKKDLTWKDAQEIAISYESSKREADQVTEKSMQDVNRISRQEQGRGSGGGGSWNGGGNRGGKKTHTQKKTVQQQQCGRCLGAHYADKCPYKKAKCYGCQRVGHIHRACRSTMTVKQSQNSRPSKSDKKTHLVSMDQEIADLEETLELTTLFSLENDESHGNGKESHGSDKEFRATVNVEGRPITFVIDTGASISTISETTYYTYLPGVKLQPTSAVLRSYSGDVIPVAGEIFTEIEYEGHKLNVKFVVVKGSKVALLGRDLLRKMRLNWQEIFEINATEDQEFQEKIARIKRKHGNVFGHGKKDTVKKESEKVNVKMKKGIKPRFKKARSVPFALRDPVERELERQITSGVLKPVKSSAWATPIVVVPKANGDIRICGDYKVTVNPCLEEEYYPLPTEEDLFAMLARGKYFSKIDLSNAYQQLELDEESQKLLTINTHKGLFQYKRLPYGISTATSIFQSKMDKVLDGVPRTGCRVDDILIVTDTQEEHLDILDLVLTRLEEHGLQAREVKCVFGVQNVTYIGHYLDADGIHCTKDKLEAIMNMRAPENVTELRSFLGLITYYQKFIPNLSSMFQPLHELLQKDVPWEWTAECEQAMQQAKDILMREPVLIPFDPKRKLVLACDASPYGLGAVLSHVMDDGSERPIAYASRTLTKSERNYSQIEKEALGIIFGVRKFHKYLYGQKFVLYTDHKPLVAIFAPDKEVPSLVALRMQMGLDSHVVPVWDQIQTFKWQCQCWCTVESARC